MYQRRVDHPANEVSDPFPIEVYEAMFGLFAQICRFWKNLDSPENYKSRLFAFMDNRMKFDPCYRLFYISAKKTIEELVELHGEEVAYQRIFTSPMINTPPPTTPLGLLRQNVSNEFIAFQISQGGFKGFSPSAPDERAVNYPGFIAGAFVPGAAIPYRT